MDRRFNLDTFFDAHIPDTRTPWASNAVSGAQQGIGGDHLFAIGKSPGTINRTPYVIARQPQIVVLDVGANDLNSGVGGPYGGDNHAGAIIAGLDRQISLLTKAGLWTVVCTLAWRFDYHEGDARLDTIQKVNNWIVAQAGRTGVKIHDRRALNGTPSAVHGTLDHAVIGPDGVHPTNHGAREDAKLLLPILRSMVLPAPRPSDSLAGNLFVAKGLPGTSGTKGPGVTGSVATGMSLARQAGTSTAVASKELISPGSEKQVVTITPVNDGTPVHSFYLKTTADITLASLGVAAGDWIEVDVPVELDGWSGWTYYSANKTGPLALFNEQYSGRTFLWETNLNTGVPGRSMVLSAKLPIQPGAKILRWSARPIQILFRSDVAGAGTVKIGSPIIHKIGDPRAAWMLP
jgi:lysophospholipase L1-like esterase